MSEYKQDYRGGAQDTLDLVEENMDPVKLQLLIAESIALYRTTNPPKVVTGDLVVKPIRSKSIYPAPKTQPTRIASPSGPGADFPQLTGVTICGWHQGLLKKFLPKESNPYLIRWACKPYIEMQVSERIMKGLVWNYQECIENDIFEGIVGKEILWVETQKAAKPCLRFVKVIRFPTKG